MFARENALARERREEAGRERGRRGEAAEGEL